MGDDLVVPHVLVRPPSSRVAAGELTHLERQGVDVDLAREQWGGYVAAMVAAGYEPVELLDLEEHPDGVFVEDVVVVLGGPGGDAGGTAVLTRPSAGHNRSARHHGSMVEPTSPAPTDDPDVSTDGSVTVLADDDLLSTGEEWANDRHERTGEDPPS